MCPPPSMEEEGGSGDGWGHGVREGTQRGKHEHKVCGSSNFSWPHGQVAGRPSLWKPLDRLLFRKCLLHRSGSCLARSPPALGALPLPAQEDTPPPAPGRWLCPSGHVQEMLMVLGSQACIWRGGTPCLPTSCLSTSQPEGSGRGSRAVGIPPSLQGAGKSAGGVCEGNCCVGRSRATRGLSSQEQKGLPAAGF